MPNNTANITATTPRPEGEFFRAALGTEVPDDAKTALAEPFKLQGYTDEDGFTISPERETTDKKAYGGVTVYTTQDNYGVTMTVTVLETMNIEAKRTAFGDENVTDAPTDVAHSSTRLGAPTASAVCPVRPGLFWCCAHPSAVGVDSGSSAMSSSTSPSTTTSRPVGANPTARTVTTWVPAANPRANVPSSSVRTASTFVPAIVTVAPDTAVPSSALDTMPVS